MSTNSAEEFRTPSILVITVLVGVALCTVASVPPVGFAAALVAGFLTAKVLVGSGANATPVSVGQIAQGINAIPFSTVALALCVVGSTGSWLLKDGGGWTQILAIPFDLVALAAPVVAIALPVVSARRWHRGAVERAGVYASWSQTVATLLGVPLSVIERTCSISQQPSGNVHVGLGPQAAAKAADRAGLEQRVADILPGWMVDPTSNHQVLVFTPVSFEQAQQRDSLRTTGGLIAGVEQQADSHTGSQQPGDLRLTLDDLS